MAFGEVSTGQIRFQVAVNKAALIKGHAAGLLNVIHQQICNANVGYGIHLSVLQDGTHVNSNSKY